MKPDRESRMSHELLFDEKSHTYSVIVDGEPKNVPSVTKILKKVGLINYRKGDDALMRMRRGTRIHKLTEYFDLGDDESLALLSKADDLQYLSAWESFKKEQRFEINMVEQKLFHPALWFAGTVDRVGEIDGNTVVLDIKTGIPHPASKLQVAAYAILVEEQNILVDRAMVVYLGDECYHIEEVESIADSWSAFESALRLYLWMEKNMGYKIIPKEE